MGKLIFVLALGYIVANGMALVSRAHGAELNNAHAECIELSISGYESRAKWDECKANYPGLPSPLRFKCVEALDKGFPSEAHVELCIQYYGTNNPYKWAKEA